MPWNQTELWFGEFTNNQTNLLLINKRKLIGKINQSILQPQWSHDDKFIYFINDENNWWNIYRITIDGQTIEHIYNIEAEFSGPVWKLGQSHYSFDSNGNIVAVYWKDGIAKLVRIDIQTRSLISLTVAEEYTNISEVNVYNQNIYFIGSSPIIPTELVEYNIQTNKKQILIRSTNLIIDQRYLSIPEILSFKTDNDIAYGFYYPPKNDDYQIPLKSNELPPLLVRIHGGPTSATT